MTIAFLHPPTALSVFPNRCARRAARNLEASRVIKVMRCKRRETPNEIQVHRVHGCASCQQDLSGLPAKLAERRQVIDVPVKRLWVTEHQIEEKRRPACLHLTRSSFPAAVTAPAQYGTGIQAVATYLVAGQTVPYARASQLMQDLFGVQLPEASIPRFIHCCYQHLAEWEARLKAAQSSSQCPQPG